MVGEEAHGEEGATPSPREGGRLRGRRKRLRRTDVAIHPAPREMPDDEAETCDGVRVWELPC